MDGSPPGSSIHGILDARILECCLSIHLVPAANPQHPRQTLCYLQKIRRRFAATVTYPAIWQTHMKFFITVWPPSYCSMSPFSSLLVLELESCWLVPTLSEIGYFQAVVLLHTSLPSPLQNWTSAQFNKYVQLTLEQHRFRFRDAGTRCQQAHLCSMYVLNYTSVQRPRCRGICNIKQIPYCYE